MWPTELRSGVFSIWSSNLLLTLLPLIDPGGRPQVNCIVGRFDLKQGKLSDDKILIIDTTAVRIRGAGQADLASEELGFVFRPRAKGIGAAAAADAVARGRHAEQPALPLPKAMCWIRCCA